MKQIAFITRGTTEQIVEFERKCDLTESLMARTLAQRIVGIQGPDEIAGIIRDWFKTVRTMSVANYMVSGMSVSVIDREK